MAPTDARGLRLALLVALLAGIALAALYRPGFGGPLILDDHLHLDPLLGAGVPAPRHWWAPLYNHSGPGGRPVAMATFLLDAALAGDGDVRPAWKRTNAILHGTTALLLGVLATRLLGGAAGRRAWFAGAAVAAIWALHPLHVSTVLYTVQRMTLLAALFTVAGLLLYLEGRRRRDAGRPGGGPRVAAAFLVCLPLAAFSKETGALLPLLWLALEATVLAGTRGLRDWRLLRALYVLCLVLPALALVAAYLGGYDERFAQAYAAKPFGPGERLLTQARVLWLYVAQALVPLPSLFGFLHDDLAVSRGLFAPASTAPALFGIAALATAAFALRRRLPVVAFGLAWFLVGHSLEGSFLPLELMFEHRNYLPSAGLLLAVAAGLQAARLGPRPAAALGLATVAVFALLTAATVRHWTSEGAVYGHVLRHHPASPWARGMAAEWLSRQGAHREALAVLDERPDAATRLHRLGVECRAGRPLDAARLQALGELLDRPFDGYTGQLVAGLADLVEARACAVDPDAFLAVLDRAFGQPFATRRSLFRLHLLRARFHQRAGRSLPAVADLESAAALRPGDPMPLLMQVEYLAQAGLIGRADALLAHATTLAQDSAWDYGPVLAGARAVLEHERARAAGGAATDTARNDP